MKASPMPNTAKSSISNAKHSKEQHQQCQTTKKITNAEEHADGQLQMKHLSIARIFSPE
jgi:hypothetical protein